MTAARFSKIHASDSCSTELLHGCPVVTAEGEKLGEVEDLLIDSRTQQVRYAMLTHAPDSAAVAIPWQALYFDSSLVRLVFYTFS